MSVFHKSCERTKWMIPSGNETYLNKCSKKFHTWSDFRQLLHNLRHPRTYSKHKIKLMTNSFESLLQ